MGGGAPRARQAQPFGPSPARHADSPSSIAAEKYDPERSSVATLTSFPTVALAPSEAVALIPEPGLYEADATCGDCHALPYAQDWVMASFAVSDVPSSDWVNGNG